MPPCPFVLVMSRRRGNEGPFGLYLARRAANKYNGRLFQLARIGGQVFRDNSGRGASLVPWLSGIQQALPDELQLLVQVIQVAISEVVPHIMVRRLRDASDLKHPLNQEAVAPGP